MAHHFDSGMFARKPAWHELGTVLDTWPGSFEEARIQAGLTWDPVTTRLWAADTDEMDDVAFNADHQLVEGWKRIVRSDNKELLSIQRDSYAVITNGEFGNIIDYVLGDNDMVGTSNLKFETLISLHGGKQIIATMYLDEPVVLPNDPSATYPYLVFISRHDGQGGLKLGPTAVRVVCANTQAIAESEMESHKFAFTIKHTKDWASKLTNAKLAIQRSLTSFKGWEEYARYMATQNAPQSMAEDFLDKWIPYSTDMSDVERNNATKKRSTFWSVYYSNTCEGIVGTKWGLLQAAIEIEDHFVRANSLDTRVTRTLTRLDNNKGNAYKVLAQL